MSGGDLAADLGRAAMLIDLGRSADAARLLSGMLAGQPDSSRGWCLLARARLGSGDAAGAVGAAATASSLDPSDDWPYRLASTALMSLGHGGAAVAAALEARSRAPQCWRPQICLAQAAIADGQLTLAADAAREALRLAPGEADVHVTAGKVALHQGDVALARARQEAALALDPASGAASNELGRICLHGGDPAAAAAHFVRAARTEPGIGAFGRNAELAITRLLRRLGGLIALTGTVAGCALIQLFSGDDLGSLILAGLLAALVVTAGLRLRAVPPRVRAMLPAAIGSRRGAQAGESAHILVRPCRPERPLLPSRLRPAPATRAGEKPCWSRGRRPARLRRPPHPRLVLCPVCGASPCRRSRSVFSRSVFLARWLSRSVVIPLSNLSGCALPAHQLASVSISKLAAVVHKEATRAGELICLARNHPERELLVRKVSPGKLK